MPAPAVAITDNARRAQAIDRFDAVAKTSPAAAAQTIIRGIEKNQPRILIGNDARFMDLLQRFRPADLLGGHGAADREDDQSGEITPVMSGPGPRSMRCPRRRQSPEAGNFL